ncbi:MAG: sugar phosphate isomerase/epimerase family protein [bacterium]
MKIGCNTVDFRKYPLEAALERIANAGYEYVEVEGNLSWCPHADPYKDDPIRFKEKINNFGFKGVSAIGTHRELITDKRAVKDIHQAIVWAKAAEIPVVLTGEGRLPEGMTEEEGLEVLQPRLEKLIEKAEVENIYLAIETHGSISLSPGGLPKILSLVSSKWMGVNFDTANPHRGDYVGTTREGYAWKLDGAKKGDEVATLIPVAHYVKHVHIKDVVGRRAVTLGQGEVNLKECLRILKQNNYEGVLSYETEGQDPLEVSQRMIENSRRYLIQLLEES